jgi:hypothetical protein
MTEATGLLAVWMEPTPEREGDLNRWYEEEHLADRLAMPGWLNARRYVSLEGAPKYVALYDLTGPEALHSPEYREAQQHSTAWTRQVVDNLQAMVRNEYELIQSIGLTPESGAPFALFVRLETDEAHDAELNQWYEQEHLAAIASVPGCLAAKRYRARAGSPRYLMVYEAATREAIRNDAWRAAAETEWTLRMRPHFRNRQDNLVQLVRYMAAE